VALGVGAKHTRKEGAKGCRAWAAGCRSEKTKIWFAFFSGYNLRPEAYDLISGLLLRAAARYQVLCRRSP
jgi:hypothetical protein